MGDGARILGAFLAWVQLPGDKVFHINQNALEGVVGGTSAMHGRRTCWIPDDLARTRG